MNKSFLYLKSLILIALICMPGLAGAVSQKEMEQARTIAAKAYLRYANDGSGYLDDLNPKTMEELEASLKPKEKENIKAFKAIAVPADYKDWNKDKLVEYWAVTAFQDKGLLEKGKGGRIRARSLINKMTIAPPQPEAPAAAAPAAAIGAQSATAQPSPAPADSATTSIADQAPILDNPADFDPEDELNVEKEANYTWVYIMILGILVAIVVALVVYAANVMKKNGRGEGYEPNALDSEEAEHYENTIADKDVEIAMLNKKLESANRQNSELKSRIESLTVELAALRQNVAGKETVNPQREETVTAPKPLMRSIFLGRANTKGIFVRADRTLNVGHSVFVLETSDGFSGSFRVADSPAAWSLALSNPAEYLETACTGHDLGDTNGVSKIATETAGTAVFEGGCWRVIRKARVRYED